MRSKLYFSVSLLLSQRQIADCNGNVIISTGNSFIGDVLELLGKVQVYAETGKKLRKVRRFQINTEKKQISKRKIKRSENG